MKVVIDNNIVIDHLNPNSQFEADAEKILRLASANEVDGFVCANSLTDIFYVVRKTRGVEYTKTKLRGLMSFTETIAVTREDCIHALESPMADFEDAVIAECAKKIDADYIVSRDEKFAKSVMGVKVVSPKQLLALTNQ
jgi:predicted nucleic acid-binding protein